MDEVTTQQAISSLQKVSQSLAALRELFEREHGRRDREADETKCAEALALRRHMARDPRPKRLSAATMLNSLPGAPRQFRSIPAQFWALDEGTAEVSCPCGRVPVVATGDLCECECERFYLFTGESVMVANGPPPPPPWMQIVAAARARRQEDAGEPG